MQIWEPGQQDILVLELKQYYVQILGKYSHDFFLTSKAQTFIWLMQVCKFYEQCLLLMVLLFSFKE